MLMMLNDNLTIRSQFYEERALLRDEERNSVLPTIARGLGSILFAINIDNSEFDMTSDNNKAIDINEKGDPLPVVCKSLANNTIGVKKRKTRVNVISLSDDDSDNDNTIHARSAPTTCLSSPDSVFPSSNYETICENSNTSHTNEPKSEFVPIGTDSLGADVVLTPIGGESTNTLNLNIEEDVSDSDKLSFSEQQDILKLDLNEVFITETINKDKEELDRIRAEMKCLKDKYEEKLIKLETQNDTFKKENDVLKMQLKKYIAAVQLLKYGEKKDFDDLSHSSSDKSMTQRLDQSSNFLYINEVNEYEKKLVQVAEMHGELVEFNDHLHRVIQQKEALIKRLKEELVDLRGPVSSELITLFDLIRK
jgi:sorting nexin-29